MWIGRQLKRRDESQVTAADMGVTTIGGEKAGVMTRGEIRDLGVYAPGGYIWRPKKGQQVLVIKGGTGGEEECVVAKEPSAGPAGMQSGEVYIHSDAASVYLKNDGTILVQSGESVLQVGAGGVAVRSGSIRLLGAVSVVGSLTVNGLACPYCAQ